MVDSHIHTECSSDCKQPLKGICETACRRGLKGIAVTDHLTVARDDAVERVRASILASREMAEVYRGKLQVFTGVELEEVRINPALTQEILSLADYDVILNSCHWVTYGPWDQYYSRISFAEPISEELLHGFLKAYFEELYHNAIAVDYDVLCHLTCPLRYMNGAYRRGVSLASHREAIDRILCVVIQQDRALEVNTSGLGGALGTTMPDETILRRYFELGGRKITLASDAHVAENVANGFKETVPALKAIGFTGVTHYEKRKPIFEPWEIAEEGLK